MGGPPALRVVEVSKRFGATQALKQASLEVRGGEIHGLVGANGSGKSTLVKILSGYHSADAGEVAIWGEPAAPVEPQKAGLAVVHQDLGLVESLSILDNVAAATGFDARAGLSIPWPRLRREVAQLLAEIGLEIPVDAPAGELTRAEQALVAIGRALRQVRAGRRHRPALLILDEPTASLTASEAERVFAVLRDLAGAGGAAVLISHKLEEVIAVSDRVTVLRDGRTVATEPAPSLDAGRLTELMLGEQPARHAASRQAAGVVRLNVRGLCSRKLEDLSFEVHAGSVLGISGLVGMGQDEVPYLVAGAMPATAGVVEVDGRALEPVSLRTARAAGLYMVPAERRRLGLWVDASAQEHLELPVAVGGRGRWWRDAQAATARGRDLLKALQVRPEDPGRPMWTFSGGNQQKVLLAMSMQLDPKVLVLHEPTQGVDVGAKREIHAALRRLAGSGAAICICSSDHEELAELCDQVLTLYDGRLSAILDRPSDADIVAAVNRRPAPSVAVAS